MSIDNKKMSSFISVILVFIIAFLFSFIYLNRDKQPSFFGGARDERVSYDAVGTASSPTTTNSLYDGNTRTFVAKDFENLHLDIQYTPGTTSGTLFALVEGSNDGGTTYFPVSSYVRPVDGVVTYLDMSVGGVTSTEGIPIAFPTIVSNSVSDSVANTTYKGMIDLPINSEYIKISVKESTTSTKGTAYIRATLTNN